MATQISSDESSRDDGEETTRRIDAKSDVLFPLEFDWGSYLVETASEAAPAANFKQVKPFDSSRRNERSRFFAVLVVKTTRERVRRRRKTGNGGSEKSRFLVHWNDYREGRTEIENSIGWNGRPK